MYVQVGNIFPGVWQPRRVFTQTSVAPHTLEGDQWQWLLPCKEDQYIVETGYSLSWPWAKIFVRVKYLFPTMPQCFFVLCRMIFVEVTATSLLFNTAHHSLAFHQFSKSNCFLQPWMYYIIRVFVERPIVLWPHSDLALYSACFQMAYI